MGVFAVGGLARLGFLISITWQVIHHTACSVLCSPPSHYSPPPPLTHTGPRAFSLYSPFFPFASDLLLYPLALFLPPHPRLLSPPSCQSQSGLKKVRVRVSREKEQENKQGGRDQEHFTPGINICRNVAGTRGTHMKTRRERRILPLSYFCMHARETCTYPATNIQKPTAKSYFNLCIVQAGREGNWFGRPPLIQKAAGARSCQL